MTYFAYIRFVLVPASNTIGDLLGKGYTSTAISPKLPMELSCCDKLIRTSNLSSSRNVFQDRDSSLS